mmetsp:Transcript_16563/g.31394  ORF Transcript_16563/g.31394 Transcript_16563/m.31394 type:complete len:176 (-) Transcript_16563:33-560(-)|eukprot:CAMPEP_0170188462 /NCGR_PEP_ID=MMETSP0040_2-20121228/44400_1 /TAXON_ID=641309 /ORGANISM="Lotharella oceanica, Strain CCMP622" /LENGTH=175 /DNA_ID=CAMNT_0010435771 /DNA_START=38 /DNA_END=565 /DNA_ORIENTATION=+
MQIADEIVQSLSTVVLSSLGQPIPTWRVLIYRLIFFFALPSFFFYHLLFLYWNSSSKKINVYLPGFSRPLTWTVNRLILFSWVWGGFLTIVVLMGYTLKLRSLCNMLTEQVKGLEKNLKNEREKTKKYKEASHKVHVGCPLDLLVEKDLAMRFSDCNTEYALRPGVLRARPGHNL